LMCGDGEIYLAGGVESMSRAPFVMPKAEKAFSRSAQVYDTTIGWRFVNPQLSALYPPFSMGETAENVAEQWKISRAAQDEFAFLSQEKYAKAEAEGRFNKERVAVEISLGKGKTELFEKAEHPPQTP